MMKKLKSDIKPLHQARLMKQGMSRQKAMKKLMNIKNLL